jgi:hypothetical protein
MLQCRAWEMPRAGIAQLALRATGLTQAHSTWPHGQPVDAVGAAGLPKPVGILTRAVINMQCRQCNAASGHYHAGAQFIIHHSSFITIASLAVCCTCCLLLLATI